MAACFPDLRRWRGVSLVVVGCLSCSALGVGAAQQVPRGLPPGDPIGESGPRVFFELRLAESEPVRGLAFEATVKNTAKKIYLHYTTVVTNSDVLKASTVENNGRYDIAITLSPEGAATMSSATSRHVGRPIAIILDGEVVAALTVREGVGQEVLRFGDFTGPEAMRIVSGLLRW